MSISSMSNTTMPRGRPACPWYARFSGSQQRRVSPTVMSCTHSRQPTSDRFNGNIDGVPRVFELSNILPSGVHAV